jgi:general secretion pathway protein K
MTSRMSIARDRQRGIALVAVLWGVLLLSVLSIAFSTRAGTDARLVRNSLERAEAASLADAGVFWALRELLRPAAARRITVEGSSYAIAFRGVQLEIAVQDEGGKVDLNAASPALLEAVLVSAGADAAAARRIAQAIADWRDRDHDRRPDGAEARDYAAAALATGPRNAAFVVLEELRAVRGMNPELFMAAAPLLTVHSGAAGIDPQVAPPRVLAALPGMTAALAASVTESRRSAARDVALPGAASSFFVGSGGQTYSIQVRVEMPAGLRFRRRAIANFTGQPQRPYRILAWSQG